MSQTSHGSLWAVRKWNMEDNISTASLISLQSCCNLKEDIFKMEDKVQKTEVSFLCWKTFLQHFQPEKNRQD